MAPRKLRNIRVETSELPPARSSDDFRLHQAALELGLADPIVIRDESDIKSKASWRDHLQPFAHQVQNLITFCRRLPVSIIADDVGLGKTISAAMVLAELIERRRVNRCLVVCTALIGPQWVEELEQHFGIDGTYAAGKNLSEAIDGDATVVVTTYHSASKYIKSASGFDMLILDEAHKLRNLHGSQKPPEMAKAVREALQKRLFRYVLMLTATPMQNRVWDLYSLIDLLTVAKGHKNPFGTPAKFQSDFVSKFRGAGWSQTPQGKRFRNVLRQYLARTRRANVNLVFPERQLQLKRVTPTATDKALLSGLKKYIQSNRHAAGLIATSLGITLMSSPQAFHEQLQNMSKTRKNLQPLLREVSELIRNNRRPSKLKAVDEICQQLAAERPESWRLVIFTSRLKTLDMLAAHLQKCGYRTGVISGGKLKQNRESVKAYSSDPPAINILISTDSGAEGLNLQAGNVLINYDLPWNPMILEQRIGRVQRLMSQFKYVVVFNLAVKGSPEDAVVARLMQKLLQISESVGDIESILEAASEQTQKKKTLETTISEMVRDSLLDQDVARQTKLAEQSVLEAKRFLQENEDELNQQLGDLTELHNSGVRPPELTKTIPSCSSAAFAQAALERAGYEVLALNGGQILQIETSDESKFFFGVFDRATWKELRRNDPQTHVELLLPGQPFFEKLLETWSRNSSALLYTTERQTEESAHRLLTAWVSQISGACLKAVELTNRQQHFCGTLRGQVTASNGVDRYEKLIECKAADAGHPEVSADELRQSAPLETNVSRCISASTARTVISDAVSDDRDMQAFSEFYSQRLKEELPRAQQVNAREQQLRDDFEVSIAASLVAAEGVSYESCSSIVTINFDGQADYTVALKLIPVTGQILDEPLIWEPCQVTKSEVPSEFLGTCDATRKRVLSHLLIQSDASDRHALAEHLEHCPVTGKRGLSDEFGMSELSGTRALRSELFSSAVSGGRYLATELFACEITGTQVLQNELVRSELSGKHFRCDEAAKCIVSNLTAHQSELQKCAVSGKLINPLHMTLCPESNTWVRTDLLVTCGETGQEVSPAATVKCTASGITVIRSRAGKSSVSKLPACLKHLRHCEFTDALVLESERIRSGVSGKFFRCDEAVHSIDGTQCCHQSESVTCEYTAKFIHPDDVVVSACTNRRMSRKDLVKSSISGRYAHSTEIHTCAVTDLLLLPDEVVTCAVSAQNVSPTAVRTCCVTSAKVLPQYLVQSSFSDQEAVAMATVPSAASGNLMIRNEGHISGVSDAFGHPSEMVTCSDSGDRLFPNELVRCEISGQDYSPTVMRRSAVSLTWAHQTKGDLCEFTGEWALHTELTVSDYSQKRLLLRDQRDSSTGRKGHHLERVTCGESRRRMFPDEGGSCEITFEQMGANFFGHQFLATCCVTGRRCRRKLLAASDFSELMCLPEHLLKSTLSDRAYCPPEEEICAATGARGHVSEFINCSYSQDRLAFDATVMCAETNQRVSPAYTVELKTGEHVLKEHAVVCSFTGETVPRNRTAVSEISDRVCKADESEICSVTKKRAHRSELDRCCITQQLVDSRLLQPSEQSGRKGIRDQMVRCAETNRLLLPEETGVCSFTEKRYTLHLLEQSPYSERLILRDLAKRCSVSGRYGPEDEGIYCPASGLWLLREYALHCCVTDEYYSPDAMVQSNISKRSISRIAARKLHGTDQFLHPDEAGYCHFVDGYFEENNTTVCKRTGLTFHRRRIGQDGVLNVFTRMMWRELTVYDYSQLIPQLKALEPKTLRRLRVLVGDKSKHNSRIVYMFGQVDSMFRLDLYNIGFVIELLPESLRIISPITRQFPDGSWKVFQ